MSMNFVDEVENPHAVRMDKMYRLQRHFYDVTRAYYLLGRDRMLDEAASGAPASVLEVGCGTGRNLIGFGKRYAGAKLHGLDISQEMLQSAGASLARARMLDRCLLAQGDATDFNAQSMFGRPRFERVFLSYTLSMVPDWQAALRQAYAATAPGGQLHVADFGSCEGLPAIFKRGLYSWLAQFHVSPREALEDVLVALAQGTGGQLQVARPFRGYALVASIRKPV